MNECIFSSCGGLKSCSMPGADCGGLVDHKFSFTRYMCPLDVATDGGRYLRTFLVVSPVQVENWLFATG